MRTYAKAVLARWPLVALGLLYTAFAVLGALDATKNFAKVTVSTGYNAAATSIVLTTGHAARLPAAPFNVVWWNATDYPDPSDDPNVEVVRVTAIATDTLTVTRAQEGTSASTKNTASKTYLMMATVTAYTLNTDIPNEMTRLDNVAKSGSSHTNITLRAVSTNAGPVEVATTVLSGASISLSFTNTAEYYHAQSADTTISLADGGGITNRTIILNATADGAHYYHVPASVIAVGNTNQAPLAAGLVTFYFWIAPNGNTNYWISPAKIATADIEDGAVTSAKITGPVSIAKGGTGGATAIAALDGLITAEADVASATTTDLGAQSSRNLRITGTTTITGFGTVTAGVMRWCRFAGALTLTHNATSLILPSGASITTAAGDRFHAISLGSGNWLVYAYQRADGTSLVGGGSGANWATGGSSTNSQLVGISYQHSVQTTNGWSNAGSGDGFYTMTNVSTGFTFTVQPHGTMTASVVKKGPAAAYSGLTKQSNSGGTMTESPATLGTDYYGPGGTDVAVADGGTGQSSAYAGYDALTQVAETTVASATTTDIGAVVSKKVSITGTTTITGFGTVAAGTERIGRFTGVLTLTHNATSLILPGGRNITTAAGDRFTAYSLGSGNWVVMNYTRANGHEPSVIVSSQTYDPANLTTGSSEIATWTVAGVTAGDTVIVSHTQVVSAPTTTAHWTWWAVATATDTVVTKLQNNTGGTVNLASGNIKIVVFK